MLHILPPPSFSPRSQSDWVLDLVAIGFDKAVADGGKTMRTLQDVEAASQAFINTHSKVS